MLPRMHMPIPIPIPTVTAMSTATTAPSSKTIHRMSPFHPPTARTQGRIPSFPPLFSPLPRRSQIIPTIHCYHPRGGGRGPGIITTQKIMIMQVQMAKKMAMLIITTMEPIIGHTWRRHHCSRPNNRNPFIRSKLPNGVISPIDIHPMGANLLWMRISIVSMEMVRYGMRMKIMVRSRIKRKNTTMAMVSIHPIPMRIRITIIILQLHLHTIHHPPYPFSTSLQSSPWCNSCSWHSTIYSYTTNPTASKSNHPTPSGSVLRDESTMRDLDRTSPLSYSLEPSTQCWSCRRRSGGG